MGPGQHVYQLVLVDAAEHKSLPATATITVQPPTTPPAELAVDIKLLLPSGEALARGGRATDRLLVNNQGVAVGQIGVSGSNVTYTDVSGTTTIGTHAPLANLVLQSFAGGRGPAIGFPEGGRMKFPRPLATHASTLDPSSSLNKRCSH